MALPPLRQAAIEDHFHLIITSAQNGPTGLTGAQTHILTDNHGRNFFCKSTTDTIMAARMVTGLQIASRLYDYGLSFVVAPRAAADGSFYLLHDDAVIALFPLIDTHPSRDYNSRTLGAAIGAMHDASRFIAADLPVRGASSAYDDFFRHGIDAVLAQVAQDETPCGRLRTLLLAHEKSLRGYVDAFYRLGAAIDASSVVTHGDAQGNVLASPDGTLALIDWDEAELAPAERDLWLLSGREGFMDGYTSVRHGFTPDPHRLLHAALKAWLEGVAIFAHNIQNGGQGARAYLDHLTTRRFSAERMARLDADIARLVR